MKKKTCNLNPKVDTTASERAKNKRFVDRFLETIIASAIIGIITGLNFGVTLAIAGVWTIAGIILAIKKPEDLFIQFILNL